MNEIPATKSIEPRPVLKHLMERSHQIEMPLSDELKRDAIRVLEDESMAIFHPEIYREAEMILERAGRT